MESAIESTSVWSVRPGGELGQDSAERSVRARSQMLPPALAVAQLLHAEMTGDALGRSLRARKPLAKSCQL